jgi:hypothetical protein
LRFGRTDADIQKHSQLPTRALLVVDTMLRARAMM